MRIFPSLRLEGGLLSPDILEQIFNGEIDGLKPEHFGLDKRRSLTDEISRVFSDANRLWETFKARVERLPQDEMGTEETRRYFVIPFLRLLGYNPAVNRRAYTVDGETFFISHRADERDDSPPIHIVGINQKLSQLSPTGRPRLSPHALVQEFLNRSEHLWGIVTNGSSLRLLRQTAYVRQQAYLEFDLRQIFEERRFEDFSLLYRLLHRTRLPAEKTEAQECWLECWYQESIEQGGRVRDRMRDGVEVCMKILANAFLKHPRNEELRKWARRNPAEEFYRQLLQLIYRLLFLLVSEERGLLTSNPLYLEHYSVSRLRKFVDDKTAYNEEEDLWHSLRVVFHLLRDAELARLLSLPPLNGKLFLPLEFDGCALYNKDLLEAIYYLFYYQESSSSRRRVNYSALDTEELGSIYESLLDLHPRIEETNGKLEFKFASGSERKSTGSYYTPSVLVGELIKSALEPVLEERLSKAKTKEEREKAILSIKVCDPACGSGHFLLATARRLGKELARIRTGEEEPPPEEVRSAVRDVIAHCIYGVDKNPLAVELCKVALWIEGHSEGKPLTFLEHRVKCGDSLVGVFPLDVLNKGIPDSAFNPLSDDDKYWAKSAEKINKQEIHQYRLAFDAEVVVSGVGDKIIRELDAIADDSPEAVRRKEKLYEDMMKDERFLILQNACDLWTYAFFQKFERGKEPVTTSHIHQILQGRQIRGDLMGRVMGARSKNRFFHWELEFPDVFQKGGFDVLLFNPPWELVELKEQEFFTSKSDEIANAPNMAERERMIRELKRKNPKLYEEYLSAHHYAEAQSKFFRGSGRFPLTARGRINLYSVFAELALNLLNSEGRVGVVIPTGIATDNNNQEFFSHIVSKGQLVSLYDFENKKKLFPAVHSMYKFTLLTLCKDGKAKDIDFVFFAHHPSDLKEERKHIRLSPSDFSLLNPNTLTCPIFRSKADGELTKLIYRRVPVLINKAKGENPWNVCSLQFFNMASDSHLFRTKEQLEKEGFQLLGNRFIKGGKVYLPLYEGKMFWFYDHRFGTYEGRVDRSDVHLPRVSTRQHSDPSFIAIPWYWVPEEEVEDSLGKRNWHKNWLIVYRRITNASNERTAIFGVLPRVGVGDTGPLLMPFKSSHLIPCLLANLNSLIFDWVARQKIGGTHLGFFFLEQLPVLPPSAYRREDMFFIVPRVIELVYTAWDVKAFADDVWKSADEELRRAIEEQWRENERETGGNEWKPPEWLACLRRQEIEEGMPFPPFRWDEGRRAVLQAELDAYFAILYGLNRKQLRYILDPKDLTEKEVEEITSDYEEVEDPLDEAGYGERWKKSDYPSESFRRLKDKEMEEFGEFLTRRLILTAWEKLINTRNNLR